MPRIHPMQAPREICTGGRLCGRCSACSENTVVTKVPSSAVMGLVAERRIQTIAKSGEETGVNLILSILVCKKRIVSFL